MKNLYLVLLSLFIATTIFGQSHSSFYNSNSKASKNNSHKIHRIIKQHSHAKAYITDVKQGLDSIAIQQKVGGTFYEVYKQLFEYDNMGNNTFVKSSHFENGNFVPETEEEYTYNSNNQIIEYVSRDWNDNDNDWANSSKIITSYSANTISIISQHWNMGSNSWVNNSKFIYYQNSNYADTLIIEQSWSNQSWNDLYKNSILRDNNNNIDIETKYNWTNNSWEADNKSEYTYDVNLNNIEILKSNYNNNSWVYYRNTLITYDNNNMIVSNVLNEYNSSSNNWALKDSLYNSNQNLDIDYYESYNRDNNLWEKKEKEDFIHDINYGYSSLLLPNDYTEDDQIISYFTHMLVSLDSYDGGDNNNWELDMKADFYYSSYTINSINKTTKEDLVILPNPTKDFIEIKGDYDKLYISIFDITGKLIKQADIVTSNKIDIRNLKNGIYFIQITDNETTSFTKKLIKY